MELIPLTSNFRDEFFYEFVLLLLSFIRKPGTSEKLTLSFAFRQRDCIPFFGSWDPSGDDDLNLTYGCAKKGFITGPPTGNFPPPGVDSYPGSPLSALRRACMYVCCIIPGTLAVVICFRFTRYRHFGGSEGEVRSTFSILSTI